MDSALASHRPLGLSRFIERASTDSFILKTLAGAPLDTESARAFLQRRIAFFAKTFAFLLAGLQALVRLVRWQHAREFDSLMGTQLANLQLVLLAMFVLIFLRLRATPNAHPRSVFELRVIDVFLALVPSLAAPLALGSLSPHLRPELLLILLVSHVTMARAVIIPSSAQRTFILATLAFLPVIIFTYIFYVQHPDPTLPASFIYVVPAIAWSCTSTLGSTIISYTIFGLRKKVVEASQIGQYVLERKIGQGGMGVVYRARHGLLRRPTAIKLLASEHADEHELRRFEREVKLTSRLTHPNTVSIYDYGHTPEGVFYYAMEYLDGLDLQQLVECAGPQPAGCVVHVLEQVASALNEAHGLGLIHRDIKPANVILCERGGLPGFAKVVDFGLVKNLRNDAVSASVSSVQTIVGTPLYLSPEQISNPEAMDGRSDLYALGALAYFLLTGLPLFEGRTLVEICGHHLYSQPVRPSERSGVEVPSEIEALVMELLAKEPAQRPASARELVLRLRALPLRRWSEEELAAWWKRVLELREQAAVSGTLARVSSPASAQTLAIDMRARGTTT